MKQRALATTLKPRTICKAGRRLRMDARRLRSMGLAARATNTA